MFWEVLKDFFARIAGVAASFGISDILDILAVTFLIYKAIQIIRETRAVQLIKGLVLIGSIYVAVIILQMNAMEYILRNVFSVGIIAAIVLFQPEIRRVIEQMGRSGIRTGALFRGFDETQQRNEIRELIRAICKACDGMSETRTGALIVIEQHSMLGEIVKTGTVIEAKASSDLIKNIFYPKSPLHDGALIVRGTQLLAAGCILPLTQNREISRELGTRHRAAIGMSEESDVIAIVVSEETGNVSVAENGNLKRNFTELTLSELLNERLLGEDATGEGTEKNGVKRIKSGVKSSWKKGSRKNFKRKK